MALLAGSSMHPAVSPTGTPSGYGVVGYPQASSPYGTMDPQSKSPYSTVDRNQPVSSSPFYKPQFNGHEGPYGRVSPLMSRVLACRRSV